VKASGLTIGGTVQWRNTGFVTETGVVSLGDGAGDKATMLETASATFDITGNSGIARGTSTASNIGNLGLFEKTGGAGTSTIAPAFVNRGAVNVSSGTLDFLGAVTGTGTDTITGASKLEFGSTAASGQTIDFSGAGGELILGSPHGFAAEVSGFDTTAKGSNDTIELLGAFQFSGFSENAAHTQGVLSFADGSVHASVTLLGNYLASHFQHASSGGNLFVTYAV
jgi:hypothetical protein